MTWTKLGDEFADQCWRLTAPAFRLHVEGLVWSNAKHLDGRLAKDEMHRWSHDPEAAEELVNLGFWEDHGGHYQIYAHQGWQMTAAQWLHQSSVNSANGRKGGRPRKPKATTKTDSFSDSKSERDGTGRDGPGQRNRGTELSNGQRKTSDADRDADYAADLKQWCEDEP